MLQVDENDMVRQVKEHPADGKLWFDLGVVRAQHEEIGPAIVAFEHAEHLLQNNLAAYRNVIALALTSENSKLASATCVRALARYPNDPELLRNYAYVLMSTSRFREAEAPLRKLQRLLPADVAVRVSLISSLRKSGASAESEVELRKLFATSLLSPEEAEALVYDFQTQKDERGTQDVLAYIARTWPQVKEHSKPKEMGPEDTVADVHVSHTPSEVNAAVQSAVKRATDLIHAEKYMEAMTFLAGVNISMPNQPDLEYESALTDVCLQRYAEAILMLQRMKTQGFDSAQVEFLLGGSFEISGDEQKAESSYRAAVAFDPKNFLYERVLGAVLQKEGRYAESADSLQQAFKLRPDDSGTLILLARSHERSGDGAGALSLLEDAIREDPTSRRAHSALAALYFKQKHIVDAEREQTIAANLEDRKIQQWTIWETDRNSNN